MNEDRQTQLLNPRCPCVLGVMSSSPDNDLLHCVCALQAYYHSQRHTWSCLFSTKAGIQTLSYMCKYTIVLFVQRAAISTLDTAHETTSQCCRSWTAISHNAAVCNMYCCILAWIVYIPTCIYSCFTAHVEYVCSYEVCIYVLFLGSHTLVFVSHACILVSLPILTHVHHRITKSARIIETHCNYGSIRKTSGKNGD